MTERAGVGYAAVGAIVALLVSWMASSLLSLAPLWVSGWFGLMVSTVAMSATLMLWASCKPARETRDAVSEAFVVVTVAFVIRAIADALLMVAFGASDAPSGAFASSALGMVVEGLFIVLPASWLLGNSERWVRRSPWWVLSEAGVVIALFACATFSTDPLSVGTLGLAALVIVVGSLAIAAVLQRLVCEIVWRVRGARAGGPATPQHAPAASPSQPWSKLRAGGVAVLVAAAVLCVLALAFFFACAAYARTHGLELRNVVYGVPSICVLLTAFVVVPFVAVEALTCRPKDRRLAVCAVLGGLVLLVVMFFATFRLDPPEEIEMADGTLALVASAGQGDDRVAYADPVSPLFRRHRAAPPREVQQPEEGSVVPATPRQGYSYHNTGVVTAIDAEARTLELAVTQSTEDFETGAQVTVDCSSAEYFDVPFEQLAVGDSVQIRSTEAQAGGVVVAQKVFAMTDAAQAETAANGEAEESESLDDVLEELSCPYTVSGTVTSAVGENGFEFRIDDGGGTIENGTELYVSTLFVERRMYGMKGLQWGMDGVIIGFSALPSEDVLRAKVIVGNDDTSSAYWENMQIAN